MENRSLLEKADLALSDLTTDGGILLPDQAQKFIRLAIKEAVLMPMITVKGMKRPKQQFDKIVFGSRIMRAGTVGAALPAADRAKPTTDQIELDVKLYKAQVNLGDETLEDNIEQGDLKQTIMQLMAQRIATDIDELLVQGDTASADTYLATMDGILKQATSNIVNAGTVPLSKNIFRDMIKAMPSEYLRGRSKFRFLTSVDAEIDYNDSLSDRATALGDSNITGEGTSSYSRIPVVAVPMFPENLGGGSNCTNVLLLDPKTIYLGIWREIRFETDKDIETGVTKIVATMRMDMKYLHEPAVVKATNVKVN